MQLPIPMNSSSSTIMIQNFRLQCNPNSKVKLLKSHFENARFPPRVVTQCMCTTSHTTKYLSMRKTQSDITVKISYMSNSSYMSNLQSKCLDINRAVLSTHQFRLQSMVHITMLMQILE